MKKGILLLTVLATIFACQPKAVPNEEYFATDTVSLNAVEAYNEIGELKNGPMVGYSTMREVMIWLQVEDGMQDFIGLSYEDGEGNSHVATPHRHDYGIVKYIAKVDEGKKYTYKVKNVNDEVLATGQFQAQPLWQWRHEPPNFDFAFGSCAYISEEAYDRPGKPYGGGYEIFETIADKEPDFMLWGGDNIYLREADWTSETGIVHRYEHTRSLLETKRLLANTHNYAIWDDHDYGPNDSDRSYPFKELTLKAFEDFWANPSYGVNGKGGITSKFQWNDCEFFLLDNRYFRTPQRKTIEPFILGEDQMEWLIDNLATSKASFKFVVVGGEVLNTAAVYENHAVFAKERARLIQLIQNENISDVVFLTGDRHHSEISVLEQAGKPTIYDITSSPLTSGSHNPRDEGNVLQVKGSFLHQRNFAFMNISGKFGERVLDIQFLDKDGKELYTYTISQLSKK